jgi:hypothetical protein
MYYVIAADGNRYGPADIATLNEWIKDRRLEPNMRLEDVQTGALATAMSVPGLNFPAPNAKVAPPPTGLGPGGAPVLGQRPGDAPYAGSPYGSAPYGQNPTPYPRHTQEGEPIGKLLALGYGLGILSIVLSSLNFFGALISAVYGIQFGNSARNQNAAAGIGAIVVNVIALIIYVAHFFVPFARR